MSDLITFFLGGASGVLVGFSLGLIGGGGSILAVPLMVYLVGVSSPHTAIGTSALAVAINAASGLFHHAKRGIINWHCGSLYAASGVIGALAGSSLGKNVDGQWLLFFFAILMLFVGMTMLRKRNNEGDPNAKLGARTTPKLLGYGMGTGMFSGFFGIGGGFLIVPGLMAATGMPVLHAIGTSLIAVTAFGLTTAANYAISGLIDWVIAASFILGGVIGSYAGSIFAKKLSDRGRLSQVFAGFLFIIAIYMLARSGSAIFS